MANFILQCISITFLMLLTTVAGTSEQGRLNQNVNTWDRENGGSEDYEMRVDRQCSVAPGDCVVEGGTIIEAKYLNEDGSEGPDVADGDLQNVPLIQDLFDKVHDAIHSNPPVFDVSYDATLGYPTFVSIDYDLGSVDDEYIVHILKLHLTS